MGLTRRILFRSFGATTVYVLGWLLLCSFTVLPVKAAEQSSRNLDSGWQFHQGEASGPAVLPR